VGFVEHLVVSALGNALPGIEDTFMAMVGHDRSPYCVQSCVQMACLQDSYSGDALTTQAYAGLK
jgi:hypothetical protein